MEVEENEVGPQAPAGVKGRGRAVEGLDLADAGAREQGGKQGGRGRLVVNDEDAGVGQVQPGRLGFRGGGGVRQEGSAWRGQWEGAEFGDHDGRALFYS